MTIKELRTERAKLFEQLKALQKKADDEKRDLTSEEVAQWDVVDQRLETITKDVERREKLENEERFLSAPQKPEPRLHPISGHEGVKATEEETKEAREERNVNEMRAFQSWIRYGVDGLNAEQRNTMARRRAFISANELPLELRAQSVGTGSAGGFIVPQGFSEALEKALKAFGGVRQVARVFPTPSGNDLPWPTVDDTANVGELLAENTAAAAQDVAFGQIILKAYKYSSKVVLVSMELLEDSFFDVDSLLRDLLAERLGRITNTHFTTGTGSGQPKGVVTEAGAGKVGLTGQTLSMIYDDIVDLEHSVDPLYRNGSTFMMADSSLKVIKKIKDTTGRPIWMPGLVAGEPNTINGYPYVINQDVATMAANAKSIIFGNFSKYVVRDVRDIALLRLVERYAEFGQVGFIAFSRADGRAINALALKYYQNSAT